ncbi:hypothetical protein DL762_003844 [Monosporascus cannonballus]|uniref:Zn(2)-C6 fungal-type domain-containing protein n=1 Tax=Monosporascus cannonballus TaxID=155416 RepID=A0ABY0H9H5_9PEZI|nr:hypothetical protein DL762_003844 [Monosporascus cannonballus]RYO92837.1 hypothetical protein DL763_004562 [Monosporascus cannonballus]
MTMAQAADPPISPSTQTSTATVQRKKFATPPVKVACLSCRAARTRCNGERPCASNEELPQDPLLIENYIEPGAGLRSLPDIWQDSDAIYDNLFKGSLDDALVDAKVPMVRTYGGNNGAVLNAYYIWIHPYFPILPPPKYALTADQVVPLLESQSDKLEEPCSAISCAISAILALIPCPEDRNPLDPDAVAWRRKYSQFLAKSALESVESEDERPESSVEPSKALEDSDDDVSREKFHPDVPVELESIVTLNLLSVYEYAQRGNLKKMRARADSALMNAMNQSLHTQSNVEDEYSEARCRVWWMTYICVSQASIVNNACLYS